MLFAILFACAPEDTSTDSLDVTDTTPPSIVADLSEMLSGEFNSNAQSLEDRSYYDIRLMGCPVDAPELGEHVLYIEQAASDTPRSPYRQRLYVLEDLELAEDGSLRGQSVVYSLVNEDDFVGGCNDGGGWSISADEVEIRTGCEVVLTEVDDAFVGGTVEDNCESDLYGASYATSEVSIYADRIESWDRGWYEDGTYAWGATDGPYIFDRIQ